MTPAPALSLRFTPQQFAALVLYETRIAALLNDAQAIAQLGAKPLAEKMAAAAATLKNAHEEFIAETQRAVQVASPADVPRLVAP